MSPECAAKNRPWIIAEAACPVTESGRLARRILPSLPVLSAYRFLPRPWIALAGLGAMLAACSHPQVKAPAPDNAGAVAAIRALGAHYESSVQVHAVRDPAVNGFLDAAHAQPLLLPFLGVAGHVHRGTEAQRRGHDADGHAQVAGGAYAHAVAAEHRACRGLGQPQRALAGAQQLLLQCDAFGELQHLVEAPARLDRTGHRQRMVGLDPPGAALGGPAHGLLQ